MARDSAPNDDRDDSRTATGGLTSVADIRARVAQIRGRIKADLDDTEAARLRAELGQVTAALAELVRASRGESTEATKTAPVPWPADMADERQRQLDWGRDSDEVAGV